MRTHWTLGVAVLFGAGILGVALGGCGKSRVVTKLIQPQAKGSVVSSVTLAVDPSTFDGECPGYFTLSGQIAVTDSTEVIYRWERSDGYVSQPFSVSVPAGGMAPVSTVWSPAPPGSSWERLHVLLPDDVISDQVSFANHCVRFTAWATAYVDPATYSGSCPSTFDFSASISTNAAGEVRYYWEGSDGSRGPDAMLQFNGAGTQSVRFSRSLIPEGTLTERLHIIAPRDTLSAEIPFTNACQGAAVQVVAYGSSSGDPCEGIYDFVAEITTNVSAVTYRWEYSDGTIGPVEALNFNAPGTQTVRMSWQPSTDTAWAKLHVLTPVDATSNLASVYYDCCWACDESMRMRERAAQLLRQARP